MEWPKEELVIDCSPSEKLVYLTIIQEEEADTTELAEKTLLSERTVRYATQGLRSLGVVEQVYVLGDARRRKYRLADEEKEQEITVV
ncbi:ArsR family transcriptional regulator [Haladaptatus sp. SPP-AMP-3]|uniref:ArsR family transcriptional regulator n=1 Tax=Haladaptatus sp. SPP-AMP-3 TaxID=3121295 RepID=UPI003C2B74BE